MGILEDMQAATADNARAIADNASATSGKLAAINARLDNLGTPPIDPPPPPPPPPPALDVPNPIWGYARPEDIAEGTPGLIPVGKLIGWDTVGGSDSNNGANVDNDAVKSLDRALTLTDGQEATIVHKWRPEPIRLNPAGDVNTAEYWFTKNTGAYVVICAEPGRQQQIDYTHSGGYTLRSDDMAFGGFLMNYIGHRPAQPVGRTWQGPGMGITGYWRPDGQPTRRSMVFAVTSVNSPGGGVVHNRTGSTVTAFCLSVSAAAFHRDQASAYGSWESAEPAAGVPHSSVVYGSAGVATRSYYDDPRGNGKTDANLVIEDYKNKSIKSAAPTIWSCLIGIGNYGRGMHAFNSSNVYGRYATLIGNNQIHATPEGRASEKFWRPSELSAMGFGYQSANVRYSDNLIARGDWAETFMQGGDTVNCGHTGTVELPVITGAISPAEASEILAALPIRSDVGALNHEGRFRESLADAIGWGIAA